MTKAADLPRLPDSAGRAFPLRFLANGRLIGLRVGGHEIWGEVANRSGFFVAAFDGTQLREIPLPHVTVLDDGGIRVAGSNGFPRLAFAVSAEEGKLRVALIRVEGMPVERDVSLGFRTGLAIACEATAVGPGVIVKPGGGDLQVYWTSAGQPISDYGGFVLTPKRRP